MAKPNVPLSQHFPLKSLCCVPSILDVSDLAMDQYLLIPFLVGWTSINPSYFDVNYRGTIGFDTLPFVFETGDDDPQFFWLFLHTVPTVPTGPSDDLRRTYIIYRMMSEATTMVFLGWNPSNALLWRLKLLKLKKPSLLTLKSKKTE